MREPRENRAPFMTDASEARAAYRPRASTAQPLRPLHTVVASTNEAWHAKCVQQQNVAACVGFPNELIPKFDSSWLDLQTALKIGGLLNRNFLFSNPFPDIFTSITFSALLGIVFPLEGQQVTMGSGLAAKMETSELTTIIRCCVRSTPHMGAKLLNSAEFGMRRPAQPLTSAEKCRESYRSQDVRKLLAIRNFLNVYVNKSTTLTAIQTVVVRAQRRAARGGGPAKKATTASNARATFSGGEPAKKATTASNARAMFSGGEPVKKEPWSRTGNK
ncbi:hypothetical protein B0H13DRAFT_1893757 [Mycena leptocephala]|nr:hypothetical protein B0H13DRAFT_1893757 [Mycena leptocephala]